MDAYALLDECKIGLGISLETSGFDSLIMQKIKVVKSYMKNAGVSDAKMEDDLAIGVIVMGVGDLWETQGGGVKFSPAFHTMLNQLTYDDVTTS
ncbi:hypothetical protein V7121_14580 [Neobacillus drentensis]